MEDVDEMENFWSTEISRCLNFVAPWKTRKMKQKKYCLPKEIQEEIKKRKDFLKRLQLKMKCGETYAKIICKLNFDA